MSTKTKSNKKARVISRKVTRTRKASVKRTRTTAKGTSFDVTATLFAKPERHRGVLAAFILESKKAVKFFQQAKAAPKTAVVGDGFVYADTPSGLALAIDMREKLLREKSLNVNLVVSNS